MTILCALLVLLVTVLATTITSLYDLTLLLFTISASNTYHVKCGITRVFTYSNKVQKGKFHAKEKKNKRHKAS